MTNGVCTKSPCKDFAKGDPKNWPTSNDCDFADKRCDLSFASGEVLFCDGVTGTCKLTNPTEKGTCTGVCAFQNKMACDVKYTKCIPP